MRISNSQRGADTTKVGLPLSVTRVPALPANEVAARLPLNTVTTPIEVGVGDRRGPISPPRVVKTAVLASAAWCALLTFDRISRGGDDARSGERGKGEAGELEHADSILEGTGKILTKTVVSG